MDTVKSKLAKLQRSLLAARQKAPFSLVILFVTVQETHEAALLPGMDHRARSLVTDRSRLCAINHLSEH